MGSPMTMVSVPRMCQPTEATDRNPSTLVLMQLRLQRAGWEGEGGSTSRLEDRLGAQVKSGVCICRCAGCKEWVPWVLPPNHHPARTPFAFRPTPLFADPIEATLPCAMPCRRGGMPLPAPEINTSSTTLHTDAASKAHQTRPL